MSKEDLKKKVEVLAGVLLSEKGYVSPVDLLLKMGKLSAKDYEDWRRGRIPYLEKVCQGSLGKLTTVMQELKQIAKDKELKPSWTAYNRWGKGPKQSLRFSKSGIAELEKAYATHYLRVVSRNKVTEESLDQVEG